MFQRRLPLLRTAAMVLICGVYSRASISAPSFSCAKADGLDEKQICADASLADSDRQMSELYTMASQCATSQTMPALRAAQRAWLTKRAACVGQARDPRETATPAEMAHTCMDALYVERIDELDSLGFRLCGEIRESTTRPGWKQYHDKRYGFTISFPESVRATNVFEGSYLFPSGAWSHAVDLTTYAGVPVVAFVFPSTPVEVRVGVRTPGPGEVGCPLQASDTDDHPAPAEIDGKTFQKIDLESAGMSHQEYGQSF